MPVEIDVAQPLAGPSRAMLVLLAAGQANASRILTQFDTEEVALLADSSADLGNIDMPSVTLAAEAFQQAYTDAAPFAAEADDFRSFLMRASTSSQPDGTALSASPSVHDKIKAVPIPKMYAFLDAHHPQLIAVILSKLDHIFASDLLKCFTAPQRKDILGRMLEMNTLDAGLLTMVESYLEDALLRNPSSPANHSAVAGILTHMDGETFDDIVGYMNERNPDLVKELRTFLFRFDDLRTLTPQHRTLVLDKVPAETLILALAAAEPSTRDAILPALTPRVRRMVEAELQSTAQPSQHATTEARRRISEIALRLMSEGLIEITDGTPLTGPGPR